MGTRHGWMHVLEAFCVCRHCRRSTVFLLHQNDIQDADIFKNQAGLISVHGAVNRYVRVEGFLSLKDTATVEPPEHVPTEIEAAFREGATCLAVECFNAAATMFRLCLDMATRERLPKSGDNPDGLTDYIRRTLKPRLLWLLKTKRLPSELEDLSDFVRDDGNDGAHAGTLLKADAEDLLDFTSALLERLYTEPKRLEIAKERRTQRRTSVKSAHPTS